MNRLNLNFALSTNEERAKFLDEYLQKHANEFQKSPLTPDELETMGNYILWGKDPITGKNSKQSKEIQLESRAKTWDAPNPCESLDALLESPVFNENELRPITNVGTKVVRETFDRQKELNRCPETLQPVLRALFREIDRLELMINFYDLAHNRRDNPPREQLIRKFSPEEQDQLRERAEKWTNFLYLKKRHLLVEFRREQYTIRDSYLTVVTKSNSYMTDGYGPAPFTFGDGVEVFPLGVNDGSRIGNLVFRDWGKVNVEKLEEKELEILSKFLWEQKAKKDTAKFFVDFGDEDALYSILGVLKELEEWIAPSRKSESWEGKDFNNGENKESKDQNEESTEILLKTFWYYVDCARLSDMEHRILEHKIRKTGNVTIAREINADFGKTYTPNYISTIFKQRIIPKICAAAKAHLEILENIFFPENFKVCSRCGKTYLRNADNFTRKSRAKDGFTSRCKSCEKELRGEKNNVC